MGRTRGNGAGEVFYPMRAWSARRFGGGIVPETIFALFTAPFFGKLDGTRFDYMPSEKYEGIIMKAMPSSVNGVVVSSYMMGGERKS